MESKKEKMEELKRSNQELEQFAYIASHDLQAPLRTITNYLQLLDKRCHDQIDEKGAKYIAHSIEACKRMHDLIQDLLNYSRAGRRENTFAAIEAESLINSVMTRMKSLLRENEAQITYDSLPTIMGNENQLIQLLQNLFENAIKYRSDTPPRLHLKAERQAQEWVFSVSDNGIGIDPEFHERIFVVFQRLHAKDEFSGTGIGLAICKKIVEYHSGRIWVESQLSQGATFYFTLPVST